MTGTLHLKRYFMYPRQRDFDLYIKMAIKFRTYTCPIHKHTLTIYLSKKNPAMQILILIRFMCIFLNVHFVKVVHTTQRAVIRMHKARIQIKQKIEG